MADLVDELRASASKLRAWSRTLLGAEPENVSGGKVLYERAADEIERLTRERDDAREAARLFARETLLTSGELLRWPCIMRSEPAGGER